jgi:dethiobiotin synthetase
MSVAETGGPPGLFVTGTDTGVGKTLVGAALVYLLCQKGCKVKVFKPFESGVADPTRIGEDGQLLAWAAGYSPGVCDISPYRLREPLAPALAARREGVEVDWAGLLASIRQQRNDGDFYLVEGAGGLLVPLAETRMVADLAADLGLPLLIVARAGLGTINHTLLTLESARMRGLKVAGWVVSGLTSDANVAEMHAADEISRLTDIPCLGVLPRVDGSPREKVVALARHMEGWGMVEDIVGGCKARGPRPEVKGQR